MDASPARLFSASGGGQTLSPIRQVVKLHMGGIAISTGAAFSTCNLHREQPAQLSLKCSISSSGVRRWISGSSQPATHCG